MTVSIAAFTNSIIRKLKLTGKDPAEVVFVIQGAENQTADLAQLKNF